VMAGFILATLAPPFDLVSRPAIAVLGAFLASAVFCILPGARTPPGDGRDNATTEP
jgi:hypothetical protein